jgi:hypothetical protein
VNVQVIADRAGSACWLIAATKAPGGRSPFRGGPPQEPRHWRLPAALVEPEIHNGPPRDSHQPSRATTLVNAIQTVILAR